MHNLYSLKTEYGLEHHEKYLVLECNRLCFFFYFGFRILLIKSWRFSNYIRNWELFFCIDFEKSSSSRNPATGNSDQPVEFSINGDISLKFGTCYLELAKSVSLINILLMHIDLIQALNFEITLTKFYFLSLLLHQISDLFCIYLWD